MLDTDNLHQYQRDIANFILKQPAAFIIAEMGLGKTVACLSAVRWLQKNKAQGAGLILAPLRVVYSVYPDEIQKWKQLQDTTYHIIHGPGKKNPLPGVDFYIANYESIPFILDSKIYRQCDFLIIDESSMVKNHQTKRFKALKKIVKHFKHRILLTGTPSPSGNLLELWSQTFLLDQGRRLTTSFYKFRNTYYEKGDYMGYTWNLQPGGRKAIQSKVKDLALVFKSKDYLQLPSITYNTVKVQLPKKAKKIYTDFEKDFLTQILDEVVTAANAAVMGAKLRQITAGGLYHNEGGYTVLHDEKIDALREIVDGTDSPVLCAFQFKFEKYAIQAEFPDAQFIDGETNITKSKKAIDRWNKGQIKLLCVHPQSVGHGLNLQAGGHVLVWLSPDWSLERTQQMNARIYRQGQISHVIIHNIVAADTIDELVIEKLKTKDKGQNSLLLALKDYAKKKTL